MATKASIPTPEEAKEHVERDFSLHLLAIAELDALNLRLLDDWAANSGFRSEADRLVGLAVVRGSTSFQAVRHLALGGFGRQAAMVNRSMCEGFLVASWVVLNPGDAVDRFTAAGDYAMHLRRAAVLEFDPSAAAELPGEILDGSLTEKEKAFGRYGERPWTGHSNIWKLYDDVKGSWSKDERDEMRRFLLLEHPDNNHELHASVMALVGHFHQPAIRGEEIGAELGVGPSPHAVESALEHAFFIHIRLMRLHADHFALGDAAKGEVAAIAKRNKHAFVRFPAEAARDVGRNEQCPCDSGRKFKNCHGMTLRS